MKTFLLSAAILLILQVSEAQISYTWNGSVSSSWTNPVNWTPNGIPGATDDVKIVTGSNICILTTGTSINDINLAGGTLDLNGQTFTVIGANALFSSGTVQNGNFIITAANTTVFGSGTVTMDCSVQITSSSISIRNTTFTGTVDITKNGASTNTNNGNNVFNGSTTITNAGSGGLTLGNTGGDKFHSQVTFNNTGSSHIHVAYNSSNNQFDGIAIFNNAPTANTSIYIGWLSSGVAFNNDIVVNSTSGNGISFCGGNGTASATLASGHTIGIGIDGFSAGELSLRQFTQLGNLPVNLTTTANSGVIFGPSSNFGGPVTISSPNIYTSTSVFSNAVIFTKTNGTSSNASSGGNIFNDDLTVNYFSSIGAGYWSFANGSPDIYNGDVYSNNKSLDRIIFGHNSTNNQFNGNFIITQTGNSRGTALTWNSGASSVMAAGNTISIGGAGFETGYFYIQGFIQNGNTPIYLNTTGSSAIYTGAGVSNNHSVIGGDFDVVAEDIYVKGATFNGNTTITKTGGTSNHNDGKQNTFNGDLTINQQSNTGYFMLGYNANDQFNGNIIVTATGKGGINLGWSNGTGSVTLAPGKTLGIGGVGYNAGTLQLGGFIQPGSDSITLNLTGTSSLNIINPGTPCSFGGPFTVTAPDIYVRGGIFNNSTSFTKTGGVSNHNDGKQNIFNGTVSINQQSNTGYFMLSYNSNDQFNDDIIVSSTGSGSIFLGYTSGSGAPVQTAGKTIQTGSGGYSNGLLSFNRFTQLGNAPVNLVLTGANTAIQFARNSVIGGNMTVSSPNIYFDGCTFNGIVDAIKTGAGNNGGRGGNIFNRHCSITNNGSGYLLLGNTDADIWNDDVIFTNNGTERILPCWSSVGNQFNGNIYLNTSGSADGIHFCGGNSTATATLAAGKTIQAGSGGIHAGYIILKQFTQHGSAPVNLTLNNTAHYLQFGPSSSIGGNVTAVTPGLYFNGCTFSGDITATKTGSGNDNSSGNNTFNGASVFINNGTGYLLMAGSSSDSYNGAVSFIKNNTGLIHPNYNKNCTYAGNLHISSSTPITFGVGTGAAELNGNSAQLISVTPGTPAPVFSRLEMNHTGSGVTLSNTSIQVSKSLVMHSGLLNTTATYMITMMNNATVAAGNALSASYINGPMRYQKAGVGASTLNFPIGNGADCRPVSLTVNHANGAIYTYQTQLFNASASALGYTLPPMTDSVSPAHYYTIARTDASENNQPVAGLSGNQTLEIFFGANDQITDGDRITVVKNTYNNPTSWVDIGGIGGPPHGGGSYLTGSITSTSSPTAFNSFSTFAIGFRRLVILPTILLDFTAKANRNTVDLAWSTSSEFNNHFFSVEKSKNGIDFEWVKNVYTQAIGGNSLTSLHYNATDHEPYSGRSYYRIKQTDLNGKITYSKVVTVQFEKGGSISVYPNPVSNILYIKRLNLNNTQVSWYDMSGRMITTQRVPILNGIATVHLNLPDGVYILKYTNAIDSWNSQRIIIRK